MKNRLVVGVIAVTGLFAGVTAASTAAPVGVAGPVAITKPCSSSYVHASLSWGHKCLREGQFCKVGNREYRRYGFYCPSDGHLRRR